MYIYLLDTQIVVVMNTHRSYILIIYQKRRRRKLEFVEEIGI